MNTILVDDEEISRTLLKKIVANNRRVELLGDFDSGELALEFLKHTDCKIDLAILDICMPGMNGMELAEHLKEMNPGMLILFETSYEEYAIDAFRMKAAGYIMKPYDRNEIMYAIESAFLLSKRNTSPVYARTFGHFDIFVEDKVLLFKSAKAKELLALLIDRQGGIVTSDEVISVLWEDRPNDVATQNLASKIGRTLKNELEEAGVGDLVELGRGTRNVNLDMLSCDLYDFLEGDEDAKRQYYGEYMIDYEWGEHRIYSLNRLLETK